MVGHWSILLGNNCRHLWKPLFMALNSAKARQSCMIRGDARTMQWCLQRCSLQAHQHDGLSCCQLLAQAAHRMCPCHLTHSCTQVPCSSAFAPALNNARAWAALHFPVAAHTFNQNLQGHMHETARSIESKHACTDLNKFEHPPASMQSRPRALLLRMHCHLLLSAHALPAYICTSP